MPELSELSSAAGNTKDTAANRTISEPLLCREVAWQSNGSWAFDGVRRRRDEDKGWFPNCGVNACANRYAEAMHTSRYHGAAGAMRSTHGLDQICSLIVLYCRVWPFEDVAVRRIVDAVHFVEAGDKLTLPAIAGMADRKYWNSDVF